jgi:hypothetical protein
MSIDPGRVLVQLIHDAGAPGAARDVSVAYARPALAPFFVGRPVADVLAMMPLLFAVCARAQALAASLAVRAAAGESLGSTIDAPTAREAAREHAWRLALDWPRELGLPPQPQLFAHLNEHIQAEKPLAVDSPPWLGRVDASPSATMRLPLMTARESLHEWPRLDGAFARAPTWRGQCAETGCEISLASTASSARSRVQARVAELRQHLDGQSTRLGLCSSVTVQVGRGRALVQTARGLLMHEVEVLEGRIQDYAIIAPTDWNCHGSGPLATHLKAAATDGSDLSEARVRHFVLAIDPCVGWDVCSM